MAVYEFSMSDPQVSADTQVVIADRFLIKERLGGGGQSRLYRAVDRETDQAVALKMIDPRGQGNSNEDWHRRQLRFRREAKILEQLKDCQQVVRFIAANCDDPMPWIAMEFLGGRPLRSLIDDDPGKMSLPRFLLLAQDIVQGLRGIHKHHILHRDLSPENILVIRHEDRSIHIRFLDFGIGKPLQEEAQPVTQMPTMMGKPAYIAPEQTRGSICAGSDVYALGVMLYEMLTGDLPIRVSSFAEVSRIRNEDPVPLVAHESSQRVPEELRSLIMSCLAKAPTDRPTLDELSECLSDVQRRHQSGEELSMEFSKWEISHLHASMENTRTVLESKMEVGPYKTEWLLNSDDNKESWLAKNPVTGQEVNLEIVKGEAQARAMRLGAFKASKALTHENIQKTYDFGEQPTFVWGALELVQGSSLGAILEVGKALSPGQILQIGEGIIEGLGAIHAQGQKHGRLTPDSVLLDEFDMVKLANAGTDPSYCPPACTITHGAQSAWAAPEILMGTKPTVASDFYSFGCLLYAMITMESPYEGSDMAQAYQHLNAPIPLAHQVNPGLKPPGLAKVTTWLLNKDPDKRPQSAARVLRQFHRCFSQNTPPSATAPEVNRDPVQPKPQSLMNRMFHRRKK